MNTPSRPAVFCMLMLAASAALADAGPRLGRSISEAEVSAWDIDVGSDGSGLPPGGGTAIGGAPIFDAKCAACHGTDGQGGPHDALVGGIGSLGADARPLKTVGSYWPYAPTIFDYVRRAMPLDAPLSLSADEVYSLVAFILERNGLIRADMVIDATSLPDVEMPNRDGFIAVYPDEH